MKQRLFLLALLMAFAAGARADEIRLKDGSKIVGTIVEFENDSFKVQTAYGFAMVRKDSIAQIIPADPGKSADAGKPAAPAGSPGTAKPATAQTTQTPAVATASATLSSPMVKPEAQPAVMRGATPAGSASSSLAATPLPMPAPNPRPAPATAAAAAPATPASTPVPAPAPVAPAPIRESVQGTLYTNQTYNFQFYRPPGWELLPEARKAMPNAITAMGTSDQTALFIVGREALKDSLESQASNAEKALQKVYGNYRQVSSTRRTVAGLPAVEWRFRGVADGHDWSVTALAIAHGPDVFTLLGMTYADSDLIQIRENVIGKMLASLQFSPAR